MRLFEHRFLYLLIALLLLLLAAPVVQLFGTGPGVNPARVVMAVLFVVMLSAAVYAVSKRRTTVIIAGSLATPTIALQVLTAFVERDGIYVAHHLMIIAFLCYTIILLFKFLFVGTRVTVNTIYAALCVFLLLGLAWAATYSLIEILAPGSFVLASSEQGGTGFMRFSAEQFIYPLYFSYVTLTTLGYGDIAPVSAVARMVATIEAITGQLYIAVLVARLVGLHIYHSTGERSDSGIR